MNVLNYLISKKNEKCEIGMDKKSRSKADEIYNNASMSELYGFIKPFLDNNDPYAFYYYSKFSLSEWDESDENYDKRYVTSLTKAADGGVADAMYILSALYFTGDSVEQSRETGRKYLDEAVSLNLGKAKLTMGINMFYGSNGYEINIEKSAELISDAVKMNVDNASSVLENLKSKLGRH